ncbi:SCP2 sterol-binding domain-containing protein [Micromonospora sp. CPCC 206060]|uniref:SCP2 sterol-binding domain-containing protein n=1 Tax=Micromonospora sp. CPCC 206060 TaxID=3122406 RepID=UPI002FF1D22F
MTGATVDFFNSIPGKAQLLLRIPMAGTLRIDLVEGHRTEHWYVTFAPGQAQVSRDEQVADAILTVPTDLFDEFVTGRSRPNAAVLRNDATVSGDIRLFLALRRFFPAAPGVRDPREVAREKVAASRQTGHQRTTNPPSTGQHSTGAGRYSGGHQPNAVDDPVTGPGTREHTG